MTSQNVTLDETGSDNQQVPVNKTSVENPTNASHPLLSQPISQQFVKLALPIIIALLINGLYSFVDAIFITRNVGLEAMASVSAVFPIYMIVISISAMLGSGMASIISRKLGEGDKESASEVFSSSLFFVVIVGGICTALMLYFQQDIYHILSLPQALLSNSTAYFTPILLVTIFSFVSGTLTECFRASGKPQEMMKVLLFSSMMNVMLDAVFIVGFEWGVAGAAWATVLAILSSLLLAIRLQVTGVDHVKFSLAKFNFNWKVHKRVLALGIPIFISHSGFAFTLMMTILAITKYSTDVSMLISAHGLLMRSFMLLFLPVLGMMIALQTLAGFNYGAGKMDRVKKSLITAIMFSIGWATIVTFILVIKPHWLLQLFTDDVALIEAASGISSIAFLGFVCGGISMMCSGLFQAMGKALPATLLDAIRTYLILMPVIIYLPTQLGTDGIWWTFPIVDVCGVLISILFTTWYLRNRLGHQRS